MNVLAKLRELLGAPDGRSSARRPSTPRRGQTSDERAARKYWDRQIADDRERRGVDDKHA
jgi:hypothetical protein